MFIFFFFAQTHTHTHYKSDFKLEYFLEQRRKTKLRNMVVEHRSGDWITEDNLDNIDGSFLNSEVFFFFFFFFDIDMKII